MQLVLGKLERCLYRWSPKKCPHCEADNDIAARYCSECDGEIVNPNDKLIADFKAAKKDPYQTQCDSVFMWSQKKTKSKRDEDMLIVDWVTEYRKFTTFFLVRRKEYDALMQATEGGDLMPRTITYRKDKNSGFFKVLAYNQPEDRLNVTN